MLKVKNLVCQYVNTRENPADVISRGCLITELKCGGMAQCGLRKT